MHVAQPKHFSTAALKPCLKPLVNPLKYFIANSLLWIKQKEVDLLSIEDRIAIELDGPQHLGNADAYRHDRRKDILLQENGYIILRFLTDHVSKHLDLVLDTILRTLSHRNTSSQQIIEKKKMRSLPIVANVQ